MSGTRFASGGSPPAYHRAARPAATSNGTRQPPARHDERVSDNLAQARRARVASLLEDNIRTELQARNAIEDLGLSQAAIVDLAQLIADGVLSAFAVDWSPKWVRPGEIHTWQASGRFFSLCPACLQDSPPAQTREEAAAWAADHQAAHGPAHSEGSPEPGQQP